MLSPQAVAFRSFTEQRDTATPQGAFLRVFGALVSYEQDLTQERVRAGLAVAQRRGKWVGQPRAIPDEQEAAMCPALEDGMRKAALCRAFGVKRATFV